MKMHLYRQGKTEAFLLSKKILIRKGFRIQIADEKKGLISANCPQSPSTDVLFFNILFSESAEVVTLSLIVNIFSVHQGTFIANEESERNFIKNFQESFQKKPVENAFKLSKEDYALAV